MMRTRAAAAAAAISASLLALGTTTATAAPAEIDHWTFSDSHIEQEEHDDFCLDEEGNDIVPFDVLFEEESHGNFRGVMRHGVFYGASTVHVEQSWTNVETGLSFSSVWQGQDKDQAVTLNEDGTTTITILFTGPTKYYGSDGSLLFTDVGRTFSTIVVDEDGEFLEFVGADSKGRFETMDRDFCADLIEFTG